MYSNVRPELDNVRSGKYYFCGPGIEGPLQFNFNIGQDNALRVTDE